MKNFKKVFLFKENSKHIALSFFSILFFCSQSFSQQQDLSLIEYKPAPGQFINETGIGIPSVAENVVNNKKGMISLGAYGGYICMKLNKPIYNKKENPYGVDFVVVGNAFTNSSEPGIIMVQKDDNNNGKPDGTWYEIAGSAHYFSSTVKNYQITYSRQDANGNIPWKDNQGEAGLVLANSMHPHDFYPSSDYFSDYPQNEVSFTGTCLPSRSGYDDDTELWVNRRFKFGYCDNFSFRYTNGRFIPSNPYGKDVIPGSGGDGIDISWAIDENGLSVNLDRIDFVKIYTGVNYSNPLLGEVSTEFKGIYRTEPVPEITNYDNRTVSIIPLPIEATVGKSLKIEAVPFSDGIPTKTAIEWSVDNHKIAQITENSTLEILSEGYVKLKASVDDGQTYDEVSIKCIKPTGICKPETQKLEIKVYPTQVKDYLIIENGLNRKGTIDIISLAGQLIYHGTLQGQQQRVDFNAVPKGMYLVKLCSGKQQYIQKILVQ
ncbi:MAG: T9SS type A sorting domain-containing protein [Bacteroidales bacterium]